MNITYHCQDPKAMMGIALCGMDVTGLNRFYDAYDYPADFFNNEWITEDDSYTRCPKCMAHPDIPLLALGAL